MNIENPTHEVACAHAACNGLANWGINGTGPAFDYHAGFTHINMVRSEIYKCLRSQWEGSLVSTLCWTNYQIMCQVDCTPRESIVNNDYTV